MGVKETTFALRETLVLTAHTQPTKSVWPINQKDSKHLSSLTICLHHRWTRQKIIGLLVIHLQGTVAWPDLFIISHGFIIINVMPFFFALCLDNIWIIQSNLSNTLLLLKYWNTIIHDHKIKWYKSTTYLLYFVKYDWHNILLHYSITLKTWQDPWPKYCNLR